MFTIHLGIFCLQENIKIKLFHQEYRKDALKYNR